jgi:hypothetical protein
MLDIYLAVTASGVPNFQGLRIPLPTNLNLPQWREAAAGYQDKEVVDLLTYGFPVSYEGPIPTPTFENDSSAKQYSADVEKYVGTETGEGAMLGPFPEEPFTPWCQVNPLLTRPKKDSDTRRVIVDLSWPQPPLHSVNAGTPTETYLGVPTKMKLPSTEDLCQRIRLAGPGCYMYSADVARAYRQIPLDPTGYCLMCVKTKSGYFVDLSLPFGMRWAAACCQRVTSLVTHLLAKRGLDILVYIDDFAGVSRSRESAMQHFNTLQATLRQLGLQEASHKASPPTQKLVWLGLEFNSVDMTVALPKDKLQATLQLVSEWQGKHSATLHSLRVLMGKLLYVAQVSPPGRLFLNRMLATLRSYPPWATSPSPSSSRRT